MKNPINESPAIVPTEQGLTTAKYNFLSGS